MLYSSFQPSKYEYDFFIAANLQALNSVPESLLMLYNAGPGAERPTEGGLFLHVGLQNGILIRSEVGACVLTRAASLCISGGNGGRTALHVGLQNAILIRMDTCVSRWACQATCTEPGMSWCLEMAP